jgi:hypothetical protein
MRTVRVLVSQPYFSQPQKKLNTKDVLVLRSTASARAMRVRFAALCHSPSTHTLGRFVNKPLQRLFCCEGEFDSPPIKPPHTEMVPGLEWNLARLIQILNRDVVDNPLLCCNRVATSGARRPTVRSSLGCDEPNLGALSPTGLGTLRVWLRFQR